MQLQAGHKSETWGQPACSLDTHPTLDLAPPHSDHVSLSLILCPGQRRRRLPAPSPLLGNRAGLGSESYRLNTFERRKNAKLPVSVKLPSPCLPYTPPLPAIMF